MEEDDYEAVSSVLRRRYISQGPSLVDFERGVEGYCGVEKCLAVSSATAAIYMTCCALGLGKGDYAWTTAMSFVATANGMRQTGATVDFIDIDSQTFNLDLNILEQKLEDAKKYLMMFTKIKIKDISVYLMSYILELIHMKRLQAHTGI
mgnify:CR=1 FL=1